MYDVNFMLAVATLLLVAVTWLTDFFQWRSIRSVNSFLQNSHDVGTQLGNWFLAKEKLEDGTETTNLEACSRLIGRQIAGSFSMGLKGIASGESRTIRAVEQKVLEGIQTPETKALLEAADRFGIPRDLAGLLHDILEKRGLLPEILKNNGQGEFKSGW